MSGTGFVAGAATRERLVSISTSIKCTFPGHIPLHIRAGTFCGITAAVVLARHLPVPLEAATHFFVIIGKFAIPGIAVTAMATSKRPGCEGCVS